MTCNLSVRNVAQSEHDCELAYGFLLRRTHTISANLKTSYDSHRKFFFHHPYRFWYFVLKNEQEIGLFYGTHTNTIGINVEQKSYATISCIIKYILNEYKPLPAVPSVRSGNFNINISPEDRDLNAIMLKMGFGLLQKTYRIN